MKIEKNPYMGLKMVNPPWNEIEEKKPVKKSKKKKVKE